MSIDEIKKLKDEKSELNIYRYMWLFPLGMLLGFLILDNGLYDFIQSSKAKFNRANFYDNFVFQKYCENFYWQRDEKGNFIVYVNTVYTNGVFIYAPSHFCDNVPRPNN